MKKLFKGAIILILLALSGALAGAIIAKSPLDVAVLLLTIAGVMLFYVAVCQLVLYNKLKGV